MLAQLGIQCAQRFVEQQYPRPQNQCARQRDPLLLPAGELGGLALGEGVHLHQFEGGADALGGLDLGGFVIAQPESDVVPYVHEREECIGLEDGVDRSLVWRIGDDVPAVEFDSP